MNTAEKIISRIKEIRSKGLEVSTCYVNEHVWDIILFNLRADHILDRETVPKLLAVGYRGYILGVSIRINDHISGNILAELKP